MDNIVLMMVSFFIHEMEDNGIVDAQEIGKLFNENNEKAFKNIKERKTGRHKNIFSNNKLTAISSNIVICVAFNVEL